MAWRPARSLPVLVAQLRPLAPNAPPGSFGFIGDSAHASSSDHVPHNFPGWGNSIVTAADFPERERLDAFAVLDAIRQSQDPRVKYGISRGRMFSSYRVTGYPAWTWRPYSGADRHFTHGHLSVVGDRRADGTQPWDIGVDMAKIDDIHYTLTNIDYDGTPVAHHVALADVRNRVKALRTEVAALEATMVSDELVERIAQRVVELLGRAGSEGV